MNQNLQIRDLGEQALLKRLFQFCPTDVVGDDAALLPIAPDHAGVVTTDMLVDGVHFSQQTTSPADAGWRATAANLSDLAAMGATPLGMTVALGLPGELPVSWVEQLYQGIAGCLQRFQTPIIGGDICRSPITTIGITAIGQVLPNRAMKRSYARVGDSILATGVHGASRAGLELLLHHDQGKSLAAADRDRLQLAHQRPIPRLDVIPILQAVISDIQPTASLLVAGMDTSDGLADAVLQICQASGVGAKLERTQIPIPRGITQWISEEQAIDWALYGGEDFELVLCLPPKVAEEMVKRLEAAAIVGTITEGNTVTLSDRSGQHSEQILTLDKGFQHF
ncbi:MAG: thiamine-phosphate kinase [Elainellaceae cyanobacterium]